MAYADEGMSTNRMIALGIVALLHVALGYAFVTGLALKAVKAVVNQVEAVNIEEEAPPPKNRRRRRRRKWKFRPSSRRRK